jgi:hypothetical protein
MDERYYEGLRDGLYQVLVMLNGMIKTTEDLPRADIIASYRAVKDSLLATITMTNDKIFTIRKEINDELG